MPEKIRYGDLEWALRMVEHETKKALVKLPTMARGHDGKAVIEEELDELWKEVKKYPNEDMTRMVTEATHVAAMAVRFLYDLCLENGRVRKSTQR